MSAVYAASDQRWGHMVSVRGTDIVVVNLDEAIGSLKVVPPERYDEAALLFG